MLPDEYYIRLYLTIASSLFVIAWDVFYISGMAGNLKKI